jgi:hypothetical protein
MNEKFAGLVGGTVPASLKNRTPTLAIGLGIRLPGGVRIGMVGHGSASRPSADGEFARYAVGARPAQVDHSTVRLTTARRPIPCRATRVAGSQAVTSTST